MLKDQPQTLSSFHELRDAFISKKLCIIEYVKNALKHIEEINPSYNAFVEIFKTQALDRAEKLSHTIDQEPDKLNELPLLGLTIGASDFLLDYYASKTRYGSRVLDSHLPDPSSYLLDRMEGLGAIVIGKTHVSEFASSDLSKNSADGPCRSPHNPELLAGGPSGGAPCAVALGFVQAAISANLRGGSELGANHCGLYSLHLSRGKTPMPNLNESLFKPHLHYSIISKSLHDISLITDALSVADTLDPDTYPNYSYSHQTHMQEPGKFSIAWIPTIHTYTPCKELEEGYGNFFKTFREQGHEAEREFIHEIGNCHRHGQDLFTTLVSTTIASFPQIDHQLLSESTKEWATFVKRITAGDYLYGKAALQLIKQQIYSMLNQYDFVATPVSPLEFISEDQTLDDFDPIIGLQTFTWPFSLTGFSRLIIPCGKTKNGYPFGIQLIAREKEEGELLRFAYETRSMRPL